MSTNGPEPKKVKLSHPSDEFSEPCDGWIEYFDTLAFKSYYHNPKTNETVWQLPSDATIIGTKPKEEEEKKEVPILTQDEIEALRERQKADEAARSAAIARQMAQTASGPDLQKSKRQERALPLPPNLASLPPHLKVFMKHDKPPTAAELGRPARVQARPEDFKNTAYVQGQEDFNIWYGRYASDRFGEGGRRERVPAATHCNLFKDAGFTRADSNPNLAKNPICFYFAKGNCTQGHECQFYHRVPTREDSDNLDLMHDIFGRERHAQQRDDMEGVGSFNSSSTTLFVGDYKVDRLDGNFSTQIEQLLLSHFSVYGPIEDIRVIPNRNFSFVTFCYRAAAEFAKVAMSNYRLNSNDEVLTVKWAQGSRNQARIEAREFDDAKRIVMERLRQIAMDEEEYEAKQRAVIKEEGDTRPDEADTRPEEADTRPEEADTRPEEADTRPDEADTRTEEADTRTEEDYKTAQENIST